ncbi:aldehyde dehydrogenase [Xanthomonas hyacinthi]|uniref:Glyceraldehyde 3-phosphate dehydrogenase NAD(P) binding domain-containing protein n=1 Tax=Xanthomonas hyacinthi TaxID=56455 RepID=A0A2S7F084_9XANT|nr:glyceraldehyde-3-phosphate dehydrogenase [Xanthomonas hyacinthi]PPU98840.1 hypothetical protein XhyaCFBP1156_05515 [Xanthomonas hyacinthi]PPU98841.1 hypothetical protein XhyaCFBP1156_05520 [Xanthomonas hyacinthi]PPU98842.1 hypothetical protein XhyaCFBP1156_05525 [Xanthomonas hyacinthi]PPU98843.1 hypothetical protein XhyaCFBP1156_05530 [Xanthomonas hyacinthi]QGY77669.1 aldehyde dehydrogenase [Xanthomonas hyacinthi]
MAIKVGINGFGRIGRNVLRSAVQNYRMLAPFIRRVRRGRRSY